MPKNNTNPITCPKGIKYESEKLMCETYKVDYKKFWRMHHSDNCTLKEALGLTEVSKQPHVPISFDEVYDGVHYTSALHFSKKYDISYHMFIRLYKKLGLEQALSECLLRRGDNSLMRLFGENITYNATEYTSITELGAALGLQEKHHYKLVTLVTKFKLTLDEAKMWILENDGQAVQFKQRYDYDKKIFGSVAELARKYNVNKDTLNKYIKTYGFPDGLDFLLGRKTHPKSVTINGAIYRSYREASREDKSGVSLSALYKLKREGDSNIETGDIQSRKHIRDLRIFGESANKILSLLHLPHSSTLRNKGVDVEDTILSRLLEYECFIDIQETGEVTYTWQDVQVITSLLVFAERMETVRIKRTKRRSFVTCISSEKVMRNGILNNKLSLQCEDCGNIIEKVQQGTRAPRTVVCNFCYGRYNEIVGTLQIKLKSSKKGVFNTICLECGQEQEKNVAGLDKGTACCINCGNAAHIYSLFMGVPLKQIAEVCGRSETQMYTSREKLHDYIFSNMLWSIPEYIGSTADDNLLFNNQGDIECISFFDYFNKKNVLV